MPEGREGSTAAASAPGRRWLLALAAIAVLGAVGIWATTPPAVTVPGAAVWARCFGPIALLPPPTPADAVELALVRHAALEAPRLIATLAEAAEVKVEGRSAPPSPGDAGASQPAPLPAGQRIVLPPGTDWPVTLERGLAELRRADGARFLVEGRVTRFALHPAGTYEAKLAAPLELPLPAPARADSGGAVRLPPGTRVEIVLPAGEPAGDPLVVRQTERLLVAPLLLPAEIPAFLPDVRPDREAAPYLAARVSAPGLDLDPSRRTLRACLWLDEEQPRPIPISRVGASGPGAADLVMGLPADPFPWLDWHRGRKAVLAVADTDGRYAGTGAFVYPSRAWALALSTGFVLLLLLLLVWVRGAGAAWKRWLMGLFLGEDGQPSLSLFQILLWTVVTVWALLFVFFSTGNLLAMTQQVMVLLGFAGAGSLAARWVASGRPAPPSGSGRGGEVRFWALLENDRGFDLFKLQLFLFTLLIAAYVVFRVLRQSAFPVIDAEFLLLMGVSNGLYVGSKVGQPSDPLALAQQRKVAWDALRLRIADLEASVAGLEARSGDLAREIGAAADAAETQRLTDAKLLADTRLAAARKELAEARTDLAAKEAAYREAVAAAAST